MKQRGTKEKLRGGMKIMSAGRNGPSCLRCHSNKLEQRRQEKMSQ